MRFSRRSAILAALSGTALMAAPLYAQPAPLKVVTTTGMIADAARQIGGDLVDVQALMGPGVDPHAYRQTRSDIQAATRAGLVLWNGLYLEAQMEDFLLDLGRKRPVTAVAEAIPASDLIAHEDYDGRYDPHVWMVPELWAQVVAAIRDAMSEAAPEHADTFAANADVHLAEIAELASYASDVLASVPEQARVLLSAHDAFGYFGRTYGFDVVGIQGISTESEAGLNRIRELTDMLVAKDVRAVFVETSVSDRNVRALIEGAAAQGHDVAIGGELFSDAMGEPGTYEGTYLGMIDHNATAIARALGGDAPAGGRTNNLSTGS